MSHRSLRSEIVLRCYDSRAMMLIMRLFRNKFASKARTIIITTTIYLEDSEAFKTLYRLHLIIISLRFAVIPI